MHKAHSTLKVFSAHCIVQTSYCSLHTIFGRGSLTHILPMMALPTINRMMVNIIYNVNITVRILHTISIANHKTFTFFFWGGGLQDCQTAFPFQENLNQTFCKRSPSCKCPGVHKSKQLFFQVVTCNHYLNISPCEITV